METEMCQERMCVPKADDPLGLSPLTMNCINSALSMIVLAVGFIFTEHHKLLKDYSCQVKASIQNFLRVQQNNT